MDHLDKSEASDHLETRLDGLFAAYRDSIPDPEPGADFMPRVWRGIEARRSIPTSLRHLAQSFITAAAAICLLLAVFFLRPAPQSSVFTTGSYVEVLASDPAPERVAYADMSHDDAEFEEVHP